MFCHLLQPSFYHSFTNLTRVTTPFFHSLPLWPFLCIRSVSNSLSTPFTISLNAYFLFTPHVLTNIHQHSGSELLFWMFNSVRKTLVAIRRLWAINNNSIWRLDNRYSYTFISHFERLLQPYPFLFICTSQFTKWWYLFCSYCSFSSPPSRHWRIRRWKIRELSHLSHLCVPHLVSN